MSTNQSPQLVLMAAGQSSRFGVLKQLDVLTACGHTLPEFLLYDGILAGFKRIIVIVNETIREAMEAYYAPRISSRVDLKFVSQSLTDIPPGIDSFAERAKPWGTAHAILAARHLIDAPFATVNCDDFYGRKAFADLYQALATLNQNDQFFLVSYELSKTLSSFGPVSRALCKLQNGKLTYLEEHLKIAQEQDAIISRGADDEIIAKFSGNEPVAMNLYGLPPTFCEYAWEAFAQFLTETVPSHSNAEFLLPEVIQEMITKQLASMDLIPCSESWFGMTYASDRPLVEKRLSALQKEGFYPDMPTV